MPHHSTQSWDLAPLQNDSKAWFVTKWPRMLARADMLLVLEIPRSRCLRIQLFADSTHGREHQVLCGLASANPSPEALITDNSRLQHALVSAGASFHKPAESYLDKSITSMPAIHQCLLSLRDLFHTPAYRAISTISKSNEVLELWRVGYNRRDGARTA